ncbi:MAG TPA: ParB/RepB/Spo0J family partition protein [Symbiobacteriaceae bacterium]|jgi:ParB family chromosome partitioning protein
MSKKGLGRGLGALIPEVDIGDRDREAITELEIRRIKPNPKQPRQSFDQGKLEELASSIREHGVVQPIVVREKGELYEIVAGERRWRAAQLAGLTKIPALVRDFSEAEVMEIALIENLQREDLNPLEEAEAYRVLLEEFHLTQEELAKRLGRSRPQITNTLRLLNLGPVAQAEVRGGRLSMGHAKVLLGVEDSAQQGALALKVVGEGLSVRQAEELLAHVETPLEKATGKKAPLSLDMLEVEQQLREYFGTPVRLSFVGQKGKLEITVFGEEGLQRILDTLKLQERSTGVPPRETFRV